MPHLEPTYLRYIYDGLIKGSIHPENAAELPEGLIGLYEEAFDEKQPVHLRQQLLERFAIWALLKKEVSTQFIAEVLNQSVDEIQEFIATYSAWFNSPESGKYQVYHERLKVYLLQKLSEGEAHVLHEKLISRLERAIEDQKADEFEWYGLAFYASHLCVAAKAQLECDQNKLIDLAQNESFKTRQYMMSASFEWTYNMLDAIKDYFQYVNDYDKALTIEIQFAAVFYREKNSFLDIIEFIKSEQLQNFEKRFISLKGNSKEEIENFFYMTILFLIEIIDCEFRSEDCKVEFLKTAMNVFDNSVPVDWALFDWENIIAPEHLIKIIERLSLYDLDSPLKIRTKLNLDDWEKKLEPKREAPEKENLIIKKSLPDFVLQRNLNKKKQLLQKGDFLNKLVENGEIERASLLVEELKNDIKQIRKPWIKYKIGNPGFGGLQLLYRDSPIRLWMGLLNDRSLKEFSISQVMDYLLFFKEINSKDYKNTSLFEFNNYWHCHLKVCDLETLHNNKELVLFYLNDLLHTDKRIITFETEHLLSVICTLILIEEFDRAFDVLKVFEFDFDMSDLIDNWQSSHYAVITFHLLKMGNTRYVEKLLLITPVVKHQDIIRKAASFYFLNNKELVNSIKFSKQISFEKNNFFKILTSEISFTQLPELLSHWLRFEFKLNFSNGISFLIPKSSKDVKYIDVINSQVTNFWTANNFIIGCHNQDKIDKSTMLSILKERIDNITILEYKVPFTIMLCQVLIANGHIKGLSYFNSLLYKFKANETINNGRWGYKDFIKDYQVKILNAIDFYNPFNFLLKIKCLFILFSIIIYQPINSIKQLEYFVKSLFQLIPKTFHLIIIAFKILLFPGVFSRWKVGRRMKAIDDLLKSGKTEEAIALFISLQEIHHSNSDAGLNFFGDVINQMKQNKSNVDFTQISSFPILYWNQDQQKTFIKDFLELPSNFVRDEKYAANLKVMISPTSIDVISVVKSSFFFSADKATRFQILYNHAVRQILTVGKMDDLEKIMNLQFYKNLKTIV
jgi:hypothetical protein